MDQQLVKGSLCSPDLAWCGPRPQLVHLQNHDTIKKVADSRDTHSTSLVTSIGFTGDVSSACAALSLFALDPDLPL